MNNKRRCTWVTDDALYQAYHDNEWGRPVKEDAVLFEFLVLESFQAGLSWYTILKKRENFSAAFDAFDYHQIAAYSEEKIQALLQDKGIVRHRLKIEAAIHNAQRFLEVQEKYTRFSDYLWGFTQGEVQRTDWDTVSSPPTTTPLSDQIAKDLKKKGFKFLGSTTVYAYLQAVGVVNDHQKECFCYTP